MIPLLFTRMLFVLLSFSPSGNLLPDNGLPKVSRVVDKVPGQNEYNVTITIKAPGLYHMVEYVDYIPAGSKVTFKEKSDHDVKQDGNTIKFIWISFPGSEEQVVVSYRISFAGIPGFFYRGELKYVIGKEAKVLELGEADIHVNR